MGPARDLSNKVSLDLTLHKYIKVFQNRPRRPENANLEIYTELKIFFRIRSRKIQGNRLVFDCHQTP